jgi:hypothetical protein
MNSKCKAAQAGKELIEVEAQIKALEERRAVLRDEVRNMLEQQIEVPGWILVEGRRANRAWESESAVIDAMRAKRMCLDDYAPRNVLSPTSLERRLGLAKFSEFRELEAFQTRGLPTIKRSDA